MPLNWNLENSPTPTEVLLSTSAPRSGAKSVIWRMNDAGGNQIDKVIDITALATGNNWMPYQITADNGAATPRSLIIKTLGTGNFFIDEVEVFRNPDANGEISGNWTLGDTTMTQVYVLQQNYPNPFNPTTQIRYELPSSASGQSNSSDGIMVNDLATGKTFRVSNPDSVKTNSYGTVIYRHGNLSQYNADWGIITFEHDRVVDVKFSPD